MTTAMSAEAAPAAKPARQTPIVEMKGLSQVFRKPLDLVEKLANKVGVANLQEQVVHAVDNVDLSIHEGEVVGLAGESGCGKSTLGRMVAGILKPTRGNISFKGRDVTTLHGADERAYALAIQMIFQDPFSSLNPRMRVKDIIGEAPMVHGITSRGQYDNYVDEMLTSVKMDPTYKDRYPHQFSGGQRQRIGIARALAVKPEFIVCDEAIAALDVSIQAQVINLFVELRDKFDLTYLFISHDLGVIQHLSDRVVIMYLGRVVEQANTEELFSKPNHPYTQALLESVPRIDKRHSTFTAVKGEIPSPLHPPSGCHFHPRCPHAMPRCKEQKPALKEIAPGHLSACHLNDAA